MRMLSSCVAFCIIFVVLSPSVTVSDSLKMSSESRPAPANLAFSGPLMPSRFTSGKRSGFSERIQMQKRGEGPYNLRPEQLPDVAASTLASLARAGVGVFVSGYRAEINNKYKSPTLDLPVKEFSESLPKFKPQKPLELYEFESCPFCRKVREALTILDIDAIIYPCPSGGERFRPKVVEMGGKAQFPYMVDPNTKFAGYESDAIIKYLFQTYGDGVIPLELSLGPITTLSCAAVSALRPGKGRKSASSGAMPSEPLELWGYEASAFVRIVRERLCELELPYKSVTVGRGSAKREELKLMAGKFQVPYLVDGNSGKALFETADIVEYLDKTYGPGTTTKTARHGESSSSIDPAGPTPDSQEPAWVSETTQGSKASVSDAEMEEVLLESVESGAESQSSRTGNEETETLKVEAEIVADEDVKK